MFKLQIVYVQEKLWHMLILNSLGISATLLRLFLPGKGSVILCIDEQQFLAFEITTVGFYEPVYIQCWRSAHCRAGGLITRDDKKTK